MPEYIHFPVKTQPPRSRRRGLFFVVAAVALVVFGGRTALSYWVDLLWFRSLGYGEVFWKTRGMEWGVFAGFAAVTFLILFGAFLALKRAHSADLPSDHTIYIAGNEIKLPVASALRLIAGIISVVIALATGAAMEAQWPTLALYWYAPATGGVADPIFGLPLNFYLFTLPAWHLLIGWLLTLAVLGCVLAVIFILITGGSRVLGGRFGSAIRPPWGGLSVAVGIFLFILALHVYVGRFDLLFEHHTIFDGVTYTDAHVTLTGLLVVCWALLLGAAIALGGAAFKPRGRWLAAAIVPAGVCYVAVGMAGWYVTSFLVKPNELDREKPYIANNIQMTRQAYGLDRFAQREFPAETTVGATDPANNQPTLQNIRLWDVQALQDTLRQIQEIRTYYDFPDIDIDRYQIDGSVARGDAGRARTERGQTAREQPQLDQRQAHLHPRLRDHDEPRERLHGRRDCPRCC